MPVKPKKQSKADERELPKKLDGTLEAAFTCSVLEKKLKDDGKVLRDQIKTYLKDNEDGFDITQNESFKTEYGSVRLEEYNSKVEIDKDKLIELVEAGKITIETLIHQASFKAELKQAVGEKVYDDLTTIIKGEKLVLKANSEFKSKIATSFDGLTDQVTPLPETPVPKVNPKVKPTTAKNSRDKIAALKKNKKKKKKKKKSTDDDLDSILGD
jgi:hypothetical protein